MRKYALAASLLLAVLLAVGLCVSCTGTTPYPPSINSLLLNGAKNLQDGWGSVAYNAFKEVLERDPGNIVAYYGISLALDLRIFANIAGVVQMLSGAPIANVTVADCEKACYRLGECDLYKDAWTTKESCMKDCPFWLQPSMFETMIDNSTCDRIHEFGLEWIIPTTPANCELVCNNLNYCGLIQPPVTFDVPTCMEYCPYAYVEHHTKCYLQHLDQCNGYDRTCFDHTTVGLQILFELIGIYLPQQLIDDTNWLLAQPTTYEYWLNIYSWSLPKPAFSINWATLQTNGARFDHGFLYVSRVLAFGFHALMLFCTSVDLELNFQTPTINFTYMQPQSFTDYVIAIIRVASVWLFDPVFPNGLIILPESYAFPQLKEGGQELGNMFGAVVDLADYMFNNHDKQTGLAVGYTDTNGNGQWDADETWDISGLGLDIKITRDQMSAIRNLSAALRDNLLERTPFPIDQTFLPVLDAFGLGAFDWVIDMFSAWFDGYGDWSGPFYNATRTGFRDLLITLIEKLKIIYQVAIDLGA